MTIQITRDHATKVLDVVDAGLCKGLGEAIPGKMCVEAAVCYALGLPHGDNPSCVAPTLRALKIRLNDKSWSSNTARAKGLRRLAVAQLGSAGHLDEKEFVKRIVAHAIGVSVPLALRSAASIHKSAEHRAALIAAAIKCEKERTRQAALDAKKTAAAEAAEAADAAYAAADAADAAANATNAAANAYAAANATNAAEAADARDKILSDYAEAIVQILIEMKAPGCQWLDLCEVS